MSSEVAAAPGQRIGTMTLVRGALGRVQVQWRPMLIYFVVVSAIAAGQQFVLKALGLDSATQSMSGPYLAYIVLASLLGGLNAAVGQRVLLAGPASWFKVNRQLLEAAGLLGAATLGPLGLMALLGDGTLLRGVAPGMALAVALGVVLAFAVMMYVLMKLVLWPLGRLTGHTEVTAAGSWRRMRKASRGYLLANALFAIPFVAVIAALSAMGGPAAAASTLGLTVTAVGTVVFSTAGMAITAELFSLRVAGPSSIAEVFD